jgi:hypothetical protein
MIPMAIIISKRGCPTQGSASLEHNLSFVPVVYQVCWTVGSVGWDYSDREVTACLFACYLLPLPTMTSISACFYLAMPNHRGYRGSGEMTGPTCLGQSLGGIGSYTW